MTGLPNDRFFEAANEIEFPMYVLRVVVCCVLRVACYVSRVACPVSTHDPRPTTHDRRYVMKVLDFLELKELTAHQYVMDKLHKVSTPQPLNPSTPTRRSFKRPPTDPPPTTNAPLTVTDPPIYP